jgi:hypothetical protein
MKSYPFILLVFLTCNSPKKYTSFDNTDIEYAKVIGEKLSNKFGGQFSKVLLSLPDTVLYLPEIENLGGTCDKSLLQKYKYNSAIYTNYDSSSKIEKYIIVIVNYYEDHKSAEAAYTLLKKIFNAQSEMKEKNYGCFYLLNILYFKDYFVDRNHLIFVENESYDKETYNEIINYLKEILK